MSAHGPRHSSEHVTLAFFCSNHDSWAMQAEEMMTKRAGRLPEGALTEEQMNDTRWVAAALLQRLPGVIKVEFSSLNVVK